MSKIRGAYGDFVLINSANDRWNLLPTRRFQRSRHKIKQELDWSWSILGLKTFEGLNLEELDGWVEFLLGVFILVLGSADSNSDLSWNVSASSGPQESVQLSVDSDILQDHKKYRVNISFRKEAIDI